ncbi:hypothetical protein ACROYT_G037666 [Oculina patagonica]
MPGVDRRWNEVTSARPERRKVFRRPPVSCDSVSITRMDGQRLYLSIKGDRDEESSSANSKEVDASGRPARKISRQESVNTDMTTLTSLCEKTDNDIRSCLNTLQPALDFFGRPIKVKPKDTEVSTSTQSAQSKPSLIWFRFNEGYSNAVRKSVKVQELL